MKAHSALPVPIHVGEAEVYDRAARVPHRSQDVDGVSDALEQLPEVSFSEPFQEHARAPQRVVYHTSWIDNRILG
jgi:squalene cyclase